MWNLCLEGDRGWWCRLQTDRINNSLLFQTGRYDKFVGYGGLLVLWVPHWNPLGLPVRSKIREMDGTLFITAVCWEICWTGALELMANEQHPLVPLVLFCLVLYKHKKHRHSLYLFSCIQNTFSLFYFKCGRLHEMFPTKLVLHW